jgi:hypothetical protein
VKEGKVIVELKRVGYGFKVAFVALVAIFLVSYGVFVVIHLATTGDLHGLLDYSVLLLSVYFIVFAPVITISLCVNLWVLLKREERLRALANHDGAVVYTASTQPDRAMALRAGESLRLSYRSATKMWQIIPLLMIIFLLLAASGEALIYTTIPAFGRSSLNPFFDSILFTPATTAPTTLDWITAAFPVAIALIGFLAFLPTLSRDTIHQIAADDQGIAVRNGHQRSFIPWNDILLFARVSRAAQALPTGGYVLWGRTARVQMIIASARVAGMRSSTRSQRASYQFDGGYESYLTDAERLLATIAARTNTSLLAMREAPLAVRLRRRAPVSTTSEEEALTLPRADSNYQPQVSENVAKLTYGEQLTLKARLAVGPVLGESLLWLIALGLIMFFILRQQPVLESLFALGPVVGYIALAFLIAFVEFAALMFTVQRRRNVLPAMSVDGFGVASKQRSDQHPVTIPWQSITAWVVIPAPPGSHRPTRYIAFGEGQKIAWAEPAGAQLAGRGVKGDRRQAYRERAAHIHALIAARTGLPLRELRVDAGPMSGQQ